MTVAWLSWIKLELGTDMVDCSLLLILFMFLKIISYIYFVMSFVTIVKPFVFIFFAINTLGVTRVICV